MAKVQTKTITYTERGLLKKLGLDDPEVLGIKGLCINGRFVASIEDVRSIDVVIWEQVDDGEHFFKD